MTRLVISFIGFNPRPPSLLISEVQTGKNSSTQKPHRDFVELLVLSGGNLGGVELVWLSGTKLASHRLPACELLAGDCLVVHLAPEGGPGEIDETGRDLSLSTGVDATAGARDFWSKAGALADATGAIAVRQRPGAAMMDCLFYADEGKTGLLPEGRLKDLVGGMGSDGQWKMAGEGPSYEAAFRWKPSVSRSITRQDGGKGNASWTLSAAGSQNPGLAPPLLAGP